MSPFSRSHLFCAFTLTHNNHNYATFLFLCSCIHKTIIYSYTCSQIYKIWFLNSRVFYVPTFYLCQFVFLCPCNNHTSLFSQIHIIISFFRKQSHFPYAPQLNVNNCALRNNYTSICPRVIIACFLNSCMLMSMYNNHIFFALKST